MGVWECCADFLCRGQKFFGQDALRQIAKFVCGFLRTKEVQVGSVETSDAFSGGVSCRTGLLLSSSWFLRCRWLHDARRRITHSRPTRSSLSHTILLLSSLPLVEMGPWTDNDSQHPIRPGCSNERQHASNDCPLSTTTESNQNGDSHAGLACLMDG